MVRKILITLGVFVMIGFSGCGGGGGGGTIPPDDGVETMAIGSSYTLDSTSVITKTTTEANVSVTTDVTTNTTTAKLLSGGATCTECTKQ
jgi:hypothetical protein